MSFSQSIKHKMLVLSARHCCVCHTYKGINIEIHHIKPQAEGGKDTLANAIALCFDCHANAGHYNPKHPKGLKLSQPELLLHKKNWFKIVNKHTITEPKDVSVELLISNNDFDGQFKPIFIKEITKYIERDTYKKIYELLGKDPMEFVYELKKKNLMGNLYNPLINKIETYDEFIEYLNGDFPEKNYLKSDDENKNTDCQPVKYNMPSLFSYNSSKEINLSNCILNLKIINYGPEILEDYKLYLTFDDIVELNRVSKRSSWDDMFKYNYNISFLEWNKVEFIPIQKVLVQNDSLNIDPLCFRTNHKTKEVNLKWELYARNIHKEGIVKLQIGPLFEINDKEKFVIGAKEMKPTIRILPKIEFD